MTVTALEYEDRQRRWKLERTEFGPFNLLVGLSGAGKTSVLQALLEVSGMGLSQPGARHPGGERRWCIEIQADAGQSYRWEALVAVLPGASASWYATHPWPVRFQQERITVGDSHVLVARSPEEFLFDGNKLPRIKTDESAISLLQGEPGIAPLHRALERITFSPTAPSPAIHRTYLEEFVSLLSGDDDALDPAERLREARDVPVLMKAHLACVSSSRAFKILREQYLAIFDNVSDVIVSLASNLDDRDVQSADEDAITVAIKERDTDQWITGDCISSGMLRTFFHLAELELSPRGTTFVIDDYENSMGVNCLPAVTELFLRRQHELQFVLTSHHPYVIQNVPKDWWRVVTRRGGVVSVRPASEIPELNTSSRQDAFTLLVNSSVYEEGIQ